MNQARRISGGLKVIGRGAALLLTGSTAPVAPPASAPTGDITEFPTGHSGAPRGITSDGTNLWFADFGAESIGRITPSGSTTEFKSGISANADPWDVAADPGTGNIWFHGKQCSQDRETRPRHGDSHRVQSVGKCVAR